MPKIIENRLIEEFKDRGSFTKEELFDFFRSFEPDLKEGTLGWRISDLKDKNIIRSLKRGVYIVSYKPKFLPAISAELLKLTRKIVEQFDEVKYCIWETGWLNEFSQHQSGKRIIIIEIEKEFVESLYYYLKDNFSYDLYVNPDEKAIDFYVSESNQPIIIKKLITRSPISKRTEGKVKLSVPQLEKIMVDLFADEKLFYLYKGSELTHICENVFNSYTINLTRLFSYAKRRKREQDIKDFIMNNIEHLIKDIIDD